MKNKSQNSWLGIVLIVIGAYFVLDMVFDLSDMFEGAWTLFIIIPCIIAIKKEGFKTMPTIGLGVGILLFLSARDIISFGTCIKLFIPLGLIVWGCNILLEGKNIHKRIADNSATTSDMALPEYSAIFSEQKITCNNEVYMGAAINAIFGSAAIDLRNAHINEDVVTNCSAIFGGIMIYLPDNVNVSVSCIPILGGIDNKAAASKRNIPGAPTVYINGTCMFGGIDIR